MRTVSTCNVSSSFLLLLTLSREHEDMIAMQIEKMIRDTKKGDFREKVFCHTLARSLVLG
jgi:hypothetical protein